MIDGRIVVDATVHPYDMGPENRGDSPIQRAQIEGMYHHHKLYTGAGREEYILERDEFISEFSHNGITGALFSESATDLAVLHALPNLGFGVKQLTDTRKMAALRSRFPDRYLFYGTITTSNTDEAIKELQWQVDEIGIDGLKLYPAFFYDGAAHGWTMNDPEFSLPLFQAASDMGIKNIAIHKAIPIGPGSINDFKVDDMDEPLFRFRHINFQIVHAGFTFLEETRVLIHRHPNLVANLESTFCNVHNRPEIFAQALGELLYWGTPEQIVYSSGCNVVHPQPLLRAFEEFEMPQQWVQDRGYPELTPDLKAKILGGNMLRLHGLDETVVAERIADDEFSHAKANGLVPPVDRVALTHQELDSMTTATEQAVEDALRTIIDPCSMSMGNPTDLVSMGLIEDISDHDGTVTVTMLLTDSACAFFQEMNRYIVDVATPIPGVESVEVAICGTKLWSPDRMRQDGRTSLPLRSARTGS